MKIFIFIAIFLSTIFLQGGCKKEESSPYHFSCKINGEKWVPIIHEGLVYGQNALGAWVYYDPQEKWLRIGSGRGITTPSKPDHYMTGGMSMNIYGFNGVGEYTLTDLPYSGSGLLFWYYLNWARMEIWYAVPMPGPGTITARTTDEYQGLLTITKFDTLNFTIEGIFNYTAQHRSYDAIVKVTDGKFFLNYEIKGMLD